MGKTRYDALLGKIRQKDDDWKRTTTLIVAASDSKDKEHADYFCDGTNDQVEINAAITAMPSVGGMVLLLEGTYYISSSININKSNFILRGQGRPTQLKRPTNTSGGATNHMLYVSGSSSVDIERLYINGNYSDGNSNNGSNIYIDGTGGNAGSIIIRECYIEESSIDGITVYCYSTIDKNMFIDNFIKYNYQYGIYLTDGTNSMSYIVGNLIEGSGYRGSISYPSSPPATTTCPGIYLHDTNQVVIIDNIVSLNGGVGIQIDGSGNNVVSNNMCRVNNGFSIRLLNVSANNVIFGNVIIGTANYLNNISVEDTSANNILVGNRLNLGQITNNALNEESHNVTA